MIRRLPVFRGAVVVFLRRAEPPRESRESPAAEERQQSLNPYSTPVAQAEPLFRPQVTIIPVPGGCKCAESIRRLKVLCPVSTGMGSAVEPFPKPPGKAALLFRTVCFPAAENLVDQDSFPRENAEEVILQRNRAIIGKITLIGV